MKWYFENQYKLAVNFTAPNIPYRETITKSAEAMYRHHAPIPYSNDEEETPLPMAAESNQT